MVVISVVRDFALYERLVRQNKCYGHDTTFVSFDNREKNEAIPILYNRFLDSYDSSASDWFVFCHEDWQTLSDMNRVVKRLSPDAIYGVCGAFYNEKNNTKYLYGQIIQSRRDGSNRIKWGVPLHRLGGVLGQGGQKTVDTVDCQCLIVHSSLIKKYGLRFDENLMFDFYTEEFSIGAREKYDIKTKVVQTKCHHYSHGNPAAPFFAAVDYVAQKYADSCRLYGATCTSALIKGKTNIKSSNLSFWCRLQRKARTLWHAIKRI